MQNIKATLTPGVEASFQMRGAVLQILSSGASAGLTVQFLSGSQVTTTVNDVVTGWKLTPRGGFDSITIRSATGDTISAIVTDGNLDVQVLDTVTTVINTPANRIPVDIGGGTVDVTATNVEISNTTDNPVPVSLVSEPGAPVAVNGMVEIGNTGDSPVPVQALPPASVPADLVPVAVTAAGALLVAADAARRGLRIRNAGTGQLAITAAAGTIFTYAALVIQPGDVWSETEAPQAAWYAVSDTGTTANVQAVA